MSRSISILDKNTLFCEGLKSLIDSTDNYSVYEIYGTGMLTISQIVNDVPDILLIDYYVPDMDCVEVINTIRKKINNIKIIVISEYLNHSDLLKIYDTGINGLISKEISFYSFIEAIDSIYDGVNYYYPEIVPLINKELLKRDLHSELLTRLTKREKHILIKVAMGLSNKEIAVDCHISERTVKNHLSSIFQKIEVNDRTQAAVFAIKTGIVHI